VIDTRVIYLFEIVIYGDYGYSYRAEEFLSPCVEVNKWLPQTPPLVLDFDLSGAS
jgi:hypothetical protein